jgi:hypothetical protein
MTRKDNGKQEQAPHRTYRGLLDILNAIYKEYKANSLAANKKAGEDSKWIRRGTIATIAYGISTLAIILVAGFQAWVARDQERRQLRAYIGLDHIVVDCCSHVDEYSNYGRSSANVAHIFIRNVGQTPASDVRVKVGFAEIYPSSLPFPNSIDFSVEHSTGPPQVLPAIEASRYMLPQAKEFYTAMLQTPAVMRAQSGLSKEVIFGHIEYTDVFQVRRYVDFCQIYYIDFFSNTNFENCPQHNAEE